MHVIIVAGGNLDHPLSRDLLERADLLIAADGGADACVATGVRPQVLVGDMDSVDPSAPARLAAAGVEVVVVPEAKDETDLELALGMAATRGATRVTVFGALGGPRLDHLLAAVGLLAADHLQSVDVRLVDHSHEVSLVHGDASIVGSPGDLVSLLPLTPVVEDVWTEGLEYPLAGEELYQGTARGVSNVLLGEAARVRHGAGRLLVVRYRDTGAPHGGEIRTTSEEKGV